MIISIHLFYYQIQRCFCKDMKQIQIYKSIDRKCLWRCEKWNMYNATTINETGDFDDKFYLEYSSIQWNLYSKLFKQHENISSRLSSNSEADASSLSFIIIIKSWRKSSTVLHGSWCNQQVQIFGFMRDWSQKG